MNIGTGGGSVATNTAFGASALAANTTGSGNVALGSSALQTNTTGANNIAAGYQAGYGNTTGSTNTAVGYQALYTKTTGDSNTALGSQALYSQTSGNESTAVGQIALYFNTTGSGNSALGRASLYQNTTGSNNTSVGLGSLQNNTTASNNTAVGYQAGYSTTTGTVNVFVGQAAGYTNSTGVGNTFVGRNAGYTSNVSAAGGDALNTCIGYSAGYSLTTGTGNNCIGSNYSGAGAGYFLTTGSRNTILGGYNGNQNSLDIRTSTGYIVLSDGDGNPRQVIDGNGTWLLGKTASNIPTAGVELRPNGLVASTLAASTNASTTMEVYSSGAGTYRFYVGLGGTISATSTTITGISDQRLKENIRDLDDGLSVLMALKPRKFDWKEGKGANIKNARGFIAQEFEQVLPDMVEEWKDPAPEGEEPYKAVNANLIPTLVKAIQEQQALITSLTTRITALEAQVGA
jgi:hypothetical protein